MSDVYAAYARTGGYLGGKSVGVFRAGEIVAEPVQTETVVYATTKYAAVLLGIDQHDARDFG